MTNNRQIISVARIGGYMIPVLSWQCHLNSYGNLCTFEVKTSIKQVKNLGYDIFADQHKTFDLECQIILIDNSGGSSQIVFDGIVDTVEGVWEHDELEITGRDYSAVLRDKEVTLDKYINQTVSQVVTGIAQDNNITANVIQTSQIAGIRASTFQGDDWSLSTTPKPAWTILQELADEVGFVVYMDTQKTLHFEPVGTGTQSHAYYWRPAGQSENPILNLEMMQQSRECANFTLRVHGYDVSGKETIYKDVIRGTGTGHLYNKSRHDLTGANYVQIANNLADQIERKELVIKLVVEGDTSLRVNDTVRIQESELNDLLGLDNRPLYINGLLHSFSMPDYGSEEGDGFLTHITCNQLTTAST